MEIIRNREVVADKLKGTVSNVVNELAFPVEDKATLSSELKIPSLFQSKKRPTDFDVVLLVLDNVNVIV